MHVHRDSLPIRLRMLRLDFLAAAKAWIDAGAPCRASGSITQVETFSSHYSFPYRVGTGGKVTVQESAKRDLHVTRYPDGTAKAQMTIGGHKTMVTFYRTVGPNGPCVVTMTNTDDWVGTNPPSLAADVKVTLQDGRYEIAFTVPGAKTQQTSARRVVSDCGMPNMDAGPDQGAELTWKPWSFTIRCPATFTQGADNTMICDPLEPRDQSRASGEMTRKIRDGSDARDPQSWLRMSPTGRLRADDGTPLPITTTTAWFLNLNDCRCDGGGDVADTVSRSRAGGNRDDDRRGGRRSGTKRARPARPDGGRGSSGRAWRRDGAGQLRWALYTFLVTKGRAAYQKVPVAARGQVTTGLFAWARTYTNSPAFKTEYARLRAEGTPQPKQYPKTVDQELADMEKQMANLKIPEATIRAQMKGARASIEADRATENEKYQGYVKAWQERYPADSQAFVAKYLREFLAATAGLDFSAKVEIADTRVGPLPQFVDPALQNKPWQAVDAVYAGRDAATAARAAAEAWLKEIGPK